ncbi:SulP family inorganic anion transporter [Paenochrobactrum glaciei]|uniref:Solute carrier family 26 protein n=1 Tax=Paenochrobactrum glaciei TaxID=486407 RepID=A0ABN1GIS3_9HYPH
MKKITSYLPILEWSKGYNRLTLTSDLIAAVIVTIMLIPQSLAYAMLAGLPPEIGLYASILPLIAYAIFGTSRTLAVGPVAVVSLMTASAISQYGGTDALTAAVTLALLSGFILLLMGILKLGFIANFLSQPVISGFITASGLLIAASQLKNIFGVSIHGDTMIDIMSGLWSQIHAVNWITLALGAGSVVFLYFSRLRLKSCLQAIGVNGRSADILTRAAPILTVAITIWLTTAFDLGNEGVSLVGAIPQGLPAPKLPMVDFELIKILIAPAFLISLIGFVESVSVAETLAAKRRQRIVPDQELIGLGAANIASAISSGYPVTGGFARSVVNYDAGAETPAASIFTALGIAVATLLLTPLLANLPQATLSATIIVAVLSLVDFRSVARVYKYSKSDFSAMAATILVTLGFGVEPGVVSGVLLSLILHLYRTSKPHMAVIGQIPDTEHFRNIERHDVLTDDSILSLRIDESLYFANRRFLENRIEELVAKNASIKHLVLVCPAVNLIDASAVESLEMISHRLNNLGIQLHLSEVKGPVMDRLQRTDFLKNFKGSVFLRQYEAVMTLQKKA